MSKENYKLINLVSLKIVKDKSYKYKEMKLKDPKSAVKIVNHFIQCPDREYLIVMTLSSTHEPTAVQICAIGSLTEAIVSPREVFKLAVINNAKSIIIFHTHPSGNCQPSKEDVEVTKRLILAGTILDIEIIDHIVVSDENYYSFAENDILFNNEDIMSQFIGGKE